MRTLSVIFLAVTMLAGCSDKVDDAETKQEGMNRVFGGLTSNKIKRSSDGDSKSKADAGDQALEKVFGHLPDGHIKWGDSDATKDKTEGKQ